MPKVTLVGLTYSPWTQRAQWALDHHRIGYEFEHYLPVVGEPMLRLRARKFSGKLSVPVLLTPHGAVSDSIKIAQHADSIGSGSKLYVEAVDTWLPVAESALDAARALVLRAVEASPLAQEESVSLPMPRALKGPTARFGTMMLRRKYAARYSEHDAEERIAQALDKLRRALDGGQYLTGTFSLADIVMTGVVQAIKPVDDKYIRLQPGTREAWTRPRLAERYSDLVLWRDRLFDKHWNVAS
jgi:glutathione S-transferase